MSESSALMGCSAVSASTCLVSVGGPEQGLPRHRWRDHRRVLQGVDFDASLMGWRAYHQIRWRPQARLVSHSFFLFLCTESTKTHEREWPASATSPEWPGNAVRENLSGLSTRWHRKTR